MINNKIVLITRPNDDQTLNFLCYWTEQIINEVLKRNFNLLDLKGNKATRKNLESYIAKNFPSLILFNGHGTKSSILGYDNESLVEYGKNENLLLGKIVYARSCESASELGAKCKAKAFIGYVWKFTFMYYENNISHPLNDKLAKKFLEPSNLVATLLLKGKSAGEAHNRSRNLMLKYYFEMVSSKGTFEERSVASFLWGNINGQRIYGDMEARI